MNPLTGQTLECGETLLWGVVTSISMVTVYGEDLEEGWMFGQKKVILGDLMWQRRELRDQNCFQCQVISGH